jgi:hypothetical protein
MSEVKIAASAAHGGTRRIAGRVHRAVTTGRFTPRRVALTALLYALYHARRPFVREHILVGPERPTYLHALGKMAMMAGIDLVTKDDPPRARAPLARLWHEDTTWHDAREGFLNGRCTNIGKIHVDEVFESVFGYASRIDPTTYQGRAVIKPDENCKGDGEFIACPVPTEAVRADRIYQRLIDNEVAPGAVREYRVSIICGEIADVIVAMRGVGQRLGGRGAGGGLGQRAEAPEAVFSAEEIDRIHEFCRRLGLEYGELDILPHVGEGGRIYILDANKTPSALNLGWHPVLFPIVFRRAAILRDRLRRSGGAEGRPAA